MNIFKKLLLGGLLSSLVLCASACASEKIEARDLTWGTGGALPQAEDFFEELPEGYSARYAERYEFTKHKTYPVEVILKSGLGWETK